MKLMRKVRKMAIIIPYKLMKQQLILIIGKLKAPSIILETNFYRKMFEPWQTRIMRRQIT